MSATSVFLVGSGPGTVDLLTVKALRLIQSADWLLYDALVDPSILAQATHAQLISVGKRGVGQSRKQSIPQSQINQTLTQLSQQAITQGKTLVRLKGGDALIFGRAEEEMNALREAGITFEIVSGITAAQAAYAHLQIPMTRRGSQRSFVLATPQVAQGKPSDLSWAKPIVAARAGAIYMAGSATDQIRGTLLSLGLSAQTPVSWVSNAARDNVRSTHQTLGSLSLSQQDQDQPVLLLIGSHATPAQSIQTAVTTLKEQTTRIVRGQFIAQEGN
jgi:uroporphyrin-III C-methyltransferase